jgi:hypothetical protein
MQHTHSATRPPRVFYERKKEALRARAPGTIFQIYFSLAGYGSQRGAAFFGGHKTRKKARPFTNVLPPPSLPSTSTVALRYCVRHSRRSAYLRPVVSHVLHLKTRCETGRGGRGAGLLSHSSRREGLFFSNDLSVLCGRRRKREMRRGVPRGLRALDRARTNSPISNQHRGGARGLLARRVPIKRARHPPFLGSQPSFRWGWIGLVSCPASPFLFVFPRVTLQLIDLPPSPHAPLSSAPSSPPPSASSRRTPSPSTCQRTRTRDTTRWVPAARARWKPWVTSSRSRARWSSSRWWGRLYKFNPVDT